MSLMHGLYTPDFHVSPRRVLSFTFQFWRKGSPMQGFAIWRLKAGSNQQYEQYEFAHVSFNEMVAA